MNIQQVIEAKKKGEVGEGEQRVESRESRIAERAAAKRRERHGDERGVSSGVKGRPRKAGRRGMVSRNMGDKEEQEWGKVRHGDGKELGEYGRALEHEGRRVKEEESKRAKS
jgi:hypothetical protein